MSLRDVVHHSTRNKAYRVYGQNPDARVRLIFPEGYKWIEFGNPETRNDPCTWEFKDVAHEFLYLSWQKLEYLENCLNTLVTDLIDLRGAMDLVESAHASELDKPPIEWQWTQIAARVEGMMRAIVPLEIPRTTDEPTEPDSE